MLWRSKSKIVGGIILVLLFGIMLGNDCLAAHSIPQNAFEQYVASGDPNAGGRSERLWQ